MQKDSCKNIKNWRNGEHSKTRTQGAGSRAEALVRTADWVSPKAMLFVIDLGHKELKQDQEWQDGLFAITLKQEWA